MSFNASSRARAALSGIERPFRGKARPDAGDTFQGPLEVAPRHAQKHRLGGQFHGCLAASRTGIL